jgi:hypothetical protein
MAERRRQQFACVEFDLIGHSRMFLGESRPCSIERFKHQEPVSLSNFFIYASLATISHRLQEDSHAL